MSDESHEAGRSQTPQVVAGVVRNLGSNPKMKIWKCFSYLGGILAEEGTSASPDVNHQHVSP